METVGIQVPIGMGAPMVPAYSSEPLGEFLFLSKSKQ